MRNIVRCQHARVDPFTDDHSRVVSQAPVQLTATDIQRDDAGGPAAEEHIGEAACRRPHIERASSGGIDAECVEPASEFQSAARKSPLAASSAMMDSLNQATRQFAELSEATMKAAASVAAAPRIA